MSGSTSFLEMLGIMVLAFAIAGDLVGTLVWISLWRDRRLQRKWNALPDPLACHDDGWDLVVDGVVIAQLTKVGPPDDPNTNFIPFEVTIVPGHEAEIEPLLYRSNHREPDDVRICYRSRGTSGDVLRDSQVLVSGEDGRVYLKAYWPID
jgi:hypothetical protein